VGFPAGLLGRYLLLWQTEVGYKRICDANASTAGFQEGVKYAFFRRAGNVYRFISGFCPLYAAKKAFSRRAWAFEKVIFPTITQP
jgi:hypothetical protein